MTQNRGPAVTVEARRLSPGRSTEAGDFTYTVVVAPLRAEPARVPAAGTERRRTTRHRTRLRSAKVVDGAGAFMTDCLVHDLSDRGGRLRLPPGVVLPRTIQIYDDQTGHLYRATVLWRRGGDVGVLLDPPRNDAQSRAVAQALRRKFYAVKG